MNPLMWLLVIIGFYIIVSFIGVVAYKIYRMAKYHMSIYD